jgi:ribosomal protein S12 methylthiotransferase accessory factor
MAVSRYQDLVSPRVGVVREIAPQVRGAEEPLPPYLYTATLSHFDFRHVDRQERLAAGKGRTEEEAMNAAIGEAVERYCGYHWDPRKTFLATWDRVQQAAIAPTDCVLYSDAQYRNVDWPFHRWSPEEETTWIAGVELPQQREIVVPASLAYLVSPVPRAEDFFTPATSNGLAAGPSLHAAILSGLYELIERDALLVTWMNRLPAVEVDLDDDAGAAGTPDATGASGAAGAVVRHYRRFGVRVRAFLMRTDLPVTVILAIAFDTNPQRPAAVVGMGCHQHPATALDKALFELCQGRPSESRRYAEHPPQTRLRRYEDVKTLDDHPAFLSMPSRAGEFAFLWSRGERTRIADLPNRSSGDIDRDLAACVASLTDRGHRVAFVDLTTPDIAPYELRVVRTIATGLQPIHFGFGQERLGGRRLFELPQRLGLADTVRTVADLNPCPHPLA